MRSSYRFLVLAVALALASLGSTGCKSKRERQRDYHKCVKACVSRNLPTGTGGATVETALRRTSGGGPCLTKCKRAKNPKGFMKTVQGWFD